MTKNRCITCIVHNIETGVRIFAVVLFIVPTTENKKNLAQYKLINFDQTH